MAVVATTLYGADGRILFPSGISGTIFFADEDLANSGAVIRSYVPTTLNNDAISGLVLTHMYGMCPVFSGTQLAILAQDSSSSNNIYLYDPSTNTLKTRTIPFTTPFPYIGSISGNTTDLFVCDTNSPPAVYVASVLPTTTFPARFEFGSAALSDGSIVIFGGGVSGFRNSDYNDAWRSIDYGQNWVQQTAAAWSFIHSYFTWAVTKTDKIFMMGGYKDAGTIANDVWMSIDKGLNWTQQTPAANWSARTGARCVALSDNSLVLFGGSAGGSQSWRSTDDGATWTQQTSNMGFTRYEMGAAVTANDSIVSTGGFVGSAQQDVWRSTNQGANWTRLSSAAPFGRRWLHSMVTMSDDSIILTGGFSSSFVILNDVWRSTDQGSTWVQQTASAEWAGLTQHQSVALPDGSIVIIGGSKNASSGTNEVWRSTNLGVNWTQLLPGSRFIKITTDNVQAPSGFNIIDMDFANSYGGSTAGNLYLYSADVAGTSAFIKQYSAPVGATSGSWADVTPSDFTTSSFLSPEPSQYSHTGLANLITGSVSDDMYSKYWNTTSGSAAILKHHGGSNWIDTGLTPMPENSLSFEEAFREVNGRMFLANYYEVWA
jgi:hypothetical protein